MDIDSYICSLRRYGGNETRQRSENVGALRPAELEIYVTDKNKNKITRTGHGMNFMVVILTLGVLGNWGWHRGRHFDANRQNTVIPARVPNGAVLRQNMAGTQASWTTQVHFIEVERRDKVSGQIVWCISVPLVEGVCSRMVVETNPWSCYLERVHVALYSVKVCSGK